jgi:EAL domain-containing protein (putative c-di-GMP-specific phosphodiesterase class I)
MVSPADDPEQSQTLARVGGDEFVILARGIRDKHDAERVGIRVHEALRSPFSHLGREFVVTPSIGIALYPQDGGDAEALMKNADTAMYEAKTAGRNTHRFYSQSMSLRSMERLDLELKLRKAVEHGDLQLYYQPKVDLHGRGVVGVEALLRWEHPDEGFISPERFVPLAEETGLIAPISEWVVTQACEQVRAWSTAGLDPLTVAINVSSQLFGFGNLATMIWGAICNSGIDAASLELEITESLLLRDLNQNHETLRAIQELGVALAVDDFGTGYSSLSYLKRLNVDALKIDRSFINDINVDADDRAICSAVVAMGHSLGLKVIAEGVETTEQLAAVCQLGCDEVQGFLFSRPVPAGEIPAIVASRRHEIITEARGALPAPAPDSPATPRRLK